jgi:hypothetical protein
MAAGFTRGHAAQAEAPGRLRVSEVVACGVASGLGAADSRHSAALELRLIIAVLASVFVPLIRAAMQETRQLRTEGIDKGAADMRGPTSRPLGLPI